MGLLFNVQICLGVSCDDPCSLFFDVPVRWVSSLFYGLLSSMIYSLFCARSWYFVWTLTVHLVFGVFHIHLLLHSLVSSVLFEFKLLGFSNSSSDLSSSFSLFRFFPRLVVLLFSFLCSKLGYVFFRLCRSFVFSWIKTLVLPSVCLRSSEAIHHWHLDSLSGHIRFCAYCLCFGLILRCSSWPWTTRGRQQVGMSLMRVD